MAAVHVTTRDGAPSIGAGSRKPGQTREGANGSGAEARGGALGRLAAAALRVPLFFKILVANAVILVVAVAASTAIATGYVRTAPESSPLAVIGFVALAGLLLMLGVNALLLWVALNPLRALERTAARVHGGDLHARAPLRPTADRELAGLIRTFNRMLDQLLVYRQRLRAIAARALDTAEDERKRIARELHDDTAQSLATLLIRLRAARVAADPSRCDRILGELRDDIAATIERMRAFAQGLRPPALDMLGLVPALEEHARRVSDATGLRIDVDAEPVQGLLAPTAELAAYRIVQEALANVVRHAEADRARITIRSRPRAVVAMIEDDGRGFAVDAVRTGTEERGLGLFGMEERAAYIGGRLRIDSGRGRGTRVMVEVPTDEEAIGDE